jgi:tol-pal system protein YbgF
MLPLPQGRGIILRKRGFSFWFSFLYYGYILFLEKTMRFLTCLLLASIFAVPAFAQSDNNDMRALMGRMDQIQRQMDTVSRQVYNGNPPPAALSNGTAGTGGNNSSLAAAMDERMSGIEGSMREINNRLDQEDNEIGQTKQQFDLYKSDMEVRMKELESHTTTAGTAPVAEKTALDATKAPDDDTANDDNAPSAAAAGAAAAKSTDAAGDTADMPTDNAASLYDASFQALREQKYDRAEKGFKQFLQKFSSDTLAGNAQYWLGETYYVRNNYTEAAKSFAIGYQKYPKSTKAPDNLLKLGLSLAQNKKTQDACVTLQQLGVQYKNAAAVIKQRATEEIKTLQCPGAAAAQ